MKIFILVTSIILLYLYLCLTALPYRPEKYCPYVESPCSNSQCVLSGDIGCRYCGSMNSGVVSGSVYTTPESRDNTPGLGWLL